METPEKKKKPLVWVIIALVVLGIGAYAFSKISHAINYESTDNAQIISNAVPVLNRVAGYVDTLSVKDYQDIKAGSMLVHIDDREYVIAVQAAEADYLSAKADLLNAQAVLQNTVASKNVAESNMNLQQVRLDKAKNDLKRDEALFKDGAITQKQLEDTRNAFDVNNKQYITTQQQVAQARAQVSVSEAQIEKAKAVIKTRETALDNAKLKLSYTIVNAPVSGKAGTINLHVGQYVQPGQPLFTIVDKEEFWIIANFKETQIENLKIGQKVDISIDGYPDLKIEGHISSFSEATGARFALLPPDNSTGNFVKITQRVPVKIDFDNLSEIKSVLKSGLSVDVEVRVK